MERRADSPHHMAASVRVHGWLGQALASPQPVLDGALAADDQPPGFGHLVYAETDPRAELLLERVRTACTPQDWAAHEFLTGELMERRGWFPSIDYALALLAQAHGLPATAGSLLFAIARTAGWTAHAIEERTEESMRFRLRGVYTGSRRLRQHYNHTSPTERMVCLSRQANHALGDDTRRAR